MEGGRVVLQDAMRSTHASRRRRRPLREDQLRDVRDIRLQGVEALPLAHDARDFDQLADVPVAVFMALRNAPHR